MANNECECGKTDLAEGELNISELSVELSGSDKDKGGNLGDLRNVVIK